MTSNQDTEAAWNYHNLTKHSRESIRSNPHTLDFDNLPSPFKIYPDIEPLPLSRDLLQSGVSALSAISGAKIESDEVSLNIEQLAAFLFYTAGVTKKKTHARGEIYFRAAACAGALYPVETYVVCGDIDGLVAGVYHFNPGDFSLRCLRDGDYRWVLAEATADEAAISKAPITLVYSAISWRSTWKYRDRAYRYHFWDNGTIIANALAMAAAHKLPAKIVAGFVEENINRLINIDGRTELALSMLALGRSETVARKPDDASAPEELDLTTIPLSDSPVDYPSIEQMHAASSLGDAGEVEKWREALIERPNVKSVEEAIRVRLAYETDLPDESIESVIQRRASTRRFARQEISSGDLSVILDRATRGFEADFLSLPETHINKIYLIVNRVEGIEAGAYFYRHDAHALELLKKGDFSDEAQHLVLDQPLGGDASVTAFFMADLNSALEAFGNRGYRAAQLEAGITGGKIYLASYSIGRGATGLTFYDDDVTDFFSPHAEGLSCMLAMSIGIPGRKPIYPFL